jgi:outer membrane protein
MKQYSKWLVVLVFCAMPAMAQVKIGYFNSDAVMKQLPDAQDAQKQLDQFVADWQQEINKMQDDWKHKFDDYDKRKLIMTDQRRAEAERELRDLDQKIVDYRNQKFGQNGELFNKQNELMKPVQDRVFKAVQDVAKDENFDYIFDKSSDVLLMYTNEKYDVSQKIADKLKVVLPPTTTSSSRPSTTPTPPGK